MAGQRSYYGNVLTTTRGQVEVPVKIQVNGALGATGTRILAGHGPQLISIGNANSGTNNSLVIQMPENYSVPVMLDVQIAGQASTTAYTARVAADYSTSTKQLTVELGSASGSTWTGATSPNVAIYLEAKFELGS